MYTVDVGHGMADSIPAHDCGDLRHEESLMKLGTFERWFVTQSLRPLLQEPFEARRRLRLGGTWPEARSLDRMWLRYAN